MTSHHRSASFISTSLPLMWVSKSRSFIALSTLGLVRPPCKCTALSTSISLFLSLCPYLMSMQRVVCALEDSVDISPWSRRFFASAECTSNSVFHSTMTLSFVWTARPSLRHTMMYMKSWVQQQVTEYSVMTGLFMLSATVTLLPDLIVGCILLPSMSNSLKYS